MHQPHFCLSGKRAPPFGGEQLQRWDGRWAPPFGGRHHCHLYGKHAQLLSGKQRVEHHSAFFAALAACCLLSPVWSFCHLLARQVQAAQKLADHVACLALLASGHCPAPTLSLKDFQATSWAVRILQAPKLLEYLLQQLLPEKLSWPHRLVYCCCRCSAGVSVLLVRELNQLQRQVWGMLEVLVAALQVH